MSKNFSDKTRVQDNDMRPTSILNRITSRDYPGTNDIVGAALATNSVTLNDQTIFHKWEYFWGTIGTNNSTSPAWLTATVASGGHSDTGSLFIAQTPEHFSYDADENLTFDGVWNYQWDGENCLNSMNMTNVANSVATNRLRSDLAYDYMGWRSDRD